MDAITNIPGFFHISEDIFNLLDKKSLVDCQLVNHSWREILNKPKFWLKRLDEDEANYDERLDKDEANANKIMMPDESDESNSDDDDSIPSLEGTSFSISKFSCFDILCWKRLSQVLDEYPHHITEVFVLFLIKMHRNKSMQPLEIVKMMLGGNTSASNKISNVRGPLAGFLDIASAINRGSGVNTSSYNFEVRGTDSEFLNFILCESHGQINIGEHWYLNPLHIAAYYGLSEVVEKLTKNKLGNNVYSPVVEALLGETPIHFAALNGHLDVVKILVDQTDNPLPSCRMSKTPLDFAKQNGHDDIVTFLLQRSGIVKCMYHYRQQLL